MRPLRRLRLTLFLMHCQSWSSLFSFHFMNCLTFPTAEAIGGRRVGPSTIEPLFLMVQRRRQAGRRETEFGRFRRIPHRRRPVSR